MQNKDIHYTMDYARTAIDMCAAHRRKGNRQSQLTQQEQHTSVMVDIEWLLDAIDAKLSLDKHNTHTWGNIRSMEHVRVLLQEIVNFLN